MPKRSKKIIFVSHCILNQNTVATNLVKKGYTSAIWEIIELCKKHDVGIEQLPCPEFSYLGLPREPMTRDQYKEIEGFVAFCRELAKDVADYIKKLKSSGFEIKGIIGIAGSPSCGVIQTNVGPSNEERRRVKEKGIFMEELSKALEREKLTIPMEDFDYRDIDDSLKRIELLLR